MTNTRLEEGIESASTRSDSEEARKPTKQEPDQAQGKQGGENVPKPSAAPVSKPTIPQMPARRGSSGEEGQEDGESQAMAPDADSTYDTHKGSVDN